MEKNLQSAEALQKLKELAESVNICMYGTLEGGKMTSRPMSTAGIDADGTIWFFSSDNTNATQESKGGSPVCLNYASPAKNTYMCVTGSAEVSHDKAKMEEMWNEIMKTWYPQGLETPRLALLKVTPDSAHYWDNDITRLRILFSYVKAKVTGEPTQANEGQEGRLEL
jgi:general stress protein 26